MTLSMRDLRLFMRLAADVPDDCEILIIENSSAANFDNAGLGVTRIVHATAGEDPADIGAVYIESSGLEPRRETCDKLPTSSMELSPLPPLIQAELRNILQRRRLRLAKEEA